MSESRIRLVRTSFLDQYDAFFGDEYAGSLRLEYGIFRVTYKSDDRCIYETSPYGGSECAFESDEDRTRHLNAACRVLLKEHAKRQEDCEPIYDLE